MVWQVGYLIRLQPKKIHRCPPRYAGCISFTSYPSLVLQGLFSQPRWEWVKGCYCESRLGVICIGKVNTQQGGVPSKHRHHAPILAHRTSLSNHPVITNTECPLHCQYSNSIVSQKNHMASEHCLKEEVPPYAFFFFFTTRTSSVNQRLHPQLHYDCTYCTLHREGKLLMTGLLSEEERFGRAHTMLSCCQSATPFSPGSQSRMGSRIHQKASAWPNVNRVFGRKTYSYTQEASGLWIELSVQSIRHSGQVFGHSIHSWDRFD